MASELQQLIDALSVRLGRSVAMDDAQIRLLAHTAHTGDIDNARIESIMRRGVSPTLSAHVTRHGAARAADIFTVPPCPEIGFAVERTGMPVRYNGALQGYLWLIGPATPRDAEALRETAGQAALILHRDHLADEVSRSHEREHVRDLVAPDLAVREEAAAALVEEGLAVAGPVVALVATVAHRTGEPLAEQQRLAMALTLGHARRRLPPSRALVLSRPDHALLLTIWPGGRSDGIERSVGELAGVLHERLVAELGTGPGTSCWVGIGGTHRRLNEAHISYREARQASEVARATGVMGPVAAYPRLGVYALLAKLPPDELAESIHPGLCRLLEPGSGQQDLVETLRTYLDQGGDAQRATALLHIHRSTLYQRLRRVKELTGLDMSHGDDRLTAHLGLKMAQLHRPV
ncbi:helix-turn-helix domain-containing protein [Streptomyces sp. NBC_00654]|uniref:PucR family transcriptional regulator n=1 Tax=Streptomyces sp. NBC_00654 TaxID=2975799 RepID=UPI002250461B|nr:PucR family transcriptional regulator [Streptomyces sp. NBC_00654]MCX4967238.1 helix-turn-helix domain-containing protein [Streptomyces sp. NBC_00654]